MPAYARRWASATLSAKMPHNASSSQSMKGFFPTSALGSANRTDPALQTWLMVQPGSSSLRIRISRDRAGYAFRPSSTYANS